jgi:predicted nucleotidyltransferase component of viral defense system
MSVEAYRDQVKLLLDVLPIVMEEPDFALKGGTAINLFEWDFPRLSVDIDLTYLPVEDRATSLGNIAAALKRISAAIEKRLPPTRVTQARQGTEGLEIKLNCQRFRTQIKIEVNQILRGHLMPVRLLPCADGVQTQFEMFVEARCLSHGELFGGKICAALDRQHPRDLFDVRQLLDDSGITDEVRLGLIAGLVSHGRPIAELVRPAPKDQRAAFANQFEGMSFKPFAYDDMTTTFDELVLGIHETLSNDDRLFLRSFEAGDPDWSRFPIEALSSMPAPRFKLANIRKFREMQPEKHAANVAALEDALSQ